MRQRLDTWRNGPVLRGEDRRVAFGNAGPDEHPLALRADDDGDLERIAGAAAGARLRAGTAAGNDGGGNDGGGREAEPDLPCIAEGHAPSATLRGARSFTAPSGACLQLPRGA